MAQIAEGVIVGRVVDARHLPRSTKPGPECLEGFSPAVVRSHRSLDSLHAVVGRNVGSRDETIRPVGFASRRHRDLPVEVVGYQALVERMGAAHFQRAQRVSFGLAILVRGGTGRHTVDFETTALSPGQMALVQPGQVQQWHLPNDLDAAVILARGSLFASPGWFPGESACGDLDSDSLTTALALVEALEREQERFVPEASSVELMGALFAPLFALFRRATMGRAGAALPPAYVAYRAAIEADLGGSRNVRDYVATLGYSERTVNRSCRLVAGLSAKQVLDGRMVLEAKRLLAHTDRSASVIGTILGFSEATNFNKFFARNAGELPSEFRRRLRAGGYQAGRHD